MLAKLKNRIAFTFLPFLHFMYRVLNRLDLLFPKVLIAYLFKINSLIRVKLGDWVLNYVVEREHVSFDADCPSSVDKTIGSIVWMFWYTGYNSAYGNYVEIYHGNNVYSFYAHASRVNVSKGQKVTKGQQIMLSGATGNVTGAHLHFEIRSPGYGYSSCVNPMKYLP